MGGSGRFTVLDPDEGCAGYGWAERLVAAWEGGS